MPLTVDSSLTDWRAEALKFEAEIKRAIIGQDEAIRLLAIAVFARGHILLEGDVGVGKTTLLRAVARVLGGDFERIEGVSREWIMNHMRAGKEVFRAEIEAAGFEFLAEPEIDGLHENYMLLFRRP